MSKLKSTPSLDDLQSIINALSVVTHLHQPISKLTTSNPSSDLKALQHGMIILKSCSVRLKTYRRYAKSVIKQRQKEKEENSFNPYDKERN